MTYNGCKKENINKCLTKKDKACFLITNRAEYVDLVKAFYEQEENVFIWNKNSISKFNDSTIGVLIAFLPIRFLDPFKENPLSFLKSRSSIKFFIAKHEYLLRMDYLSDYKLKFLKPEKHSKNLIIFSNQRSGSTMFCEEISSTNLLGYPTELVQSLIVNYSEYAACDQELLLKSLIQRSISRNGVFSVKVMMNQFTQLRKLYPTIYNYFILRLNNCYFVFFIRKNILLQALSYHHAIESNIWHSLDQRKDSLNTLSTVSNESIRVSNNVKYDYSKIKSYMRYFRGYKRYLNVLSLRLEKKTIIYYEDYIKENSRYICYILNEMDCPMNDLNLYCKIKKSYRAKKLLWKILYHYNESKTFLKTKFIK